MKVILTQDVKTLGKRGEVVTVTDGYANNFLLRRNMAVEATAGAIKQIEQQLNAKVRKQAEELANAQDVATKLQDAVIEVGAKAGGNGRLFGTVTSQQVAEEIERVHGVAIDRHKIEMPDSIKALGTYTIEIRLGNNIAAQSQLKVVSQK